MLPKAARLSNGRDFRAVYGRSRSVVTPRLALNVRFWKPQDRQDAAPETVRVRIGFSISKKTAKRAHERNVIKRRLREIVRLEILPRLRPAVSFDAVVSARSASLVTTDGVAHEASYEDLKADLVSLFEQAGVLTRARGAVA